MRDAERRVRERLASRREREPGLLDALCAGVLHRLPDGGALFFAWGSLGPAYRVPAGGRAERLRRRLRGLLAAGLLGPPAAALLAAVSGRLAPALWLVGATGAASLAALAVLTRGLARSEQRLRRGEARTRVAAALGERALRRAGATALALALASLGASAAWGGALLGAAGGVALVAAALARGGLELRRRTSGRRSSG